MYASLEVHTEATIAAGQAELLNFGALLKVSYHLPVLQSIS